MICWDISSDWNMLFTCDIDNIIPVYSCNKELKALVYDS